MSQVEPEPDVLLVLDRSGSMGQATAWRDAVAGVEASAAAHDALRFGLLTFPKAAPPPVDCSTIVDIIEQAQCQLNNPAPMCEAGSVVVPLAEHASQAIAAALAATSCSGGSPLAASLDVARQALTAQAEDVRSKLVILITDGEPNCANTTQDAISATLTAIQMLEALNIHTSVIGFSGDDAAVGSTLDKFAQAGGTGAISHSKVASAEDVVAAIDGAIAGGVCSFTLARAVDDSTLRVKLDGVLVAHDFADGFTLHDGVTVRLHGKACAYVSDGAPHAVDMKVACP